MSANKKLLLLVSVLGLMLTSCGSLNMDRLSSALAKGTQAMSLTNAELQQYVTASVQKMDAQNKVAPASSAYSQRLARLTRGLTSVGDIPLNFKVYITPEINAFACADGSVRVYSGIMDLMTDDELLGIIGHEIGHVANEDSKRAFQQELMNSALLDVVGATGSRMAALTDSQLGQLASSLTSAKFSRSQENGADDFGYEFLKGAGRNPYNMVLAFEKMQQLEQKSGQQMTGNFANMFSSHPETAERIRRMQEHCQKDGFKRPTGK